MSRRVIVCPTLDTVDPKWRENGGVMRRCSICTQRIVCPRESARLAKELHFELTCRSCWGQVLEASGTVGILRVKEPGDIPTPEAMQEIVDDFERRSAGIAGNN